MAKVLGHTAMRVAKAEQRRAHRNQKRLTARAWGGFTAREASPSGPGVPLGHNEFIAARAVESYPKHVARLGGRRRRAEHDKRRRKAEQHSIAVEEKRLRARLAKRDARDHGCAHLGCCVFPCPIPSKHRIGVRPGPKPDNVQRTEGLHQLRGITRAMRRGKSREQLQRLVTAFKAASWRFLGEAGVDWR